MTHIDIYKAFCDIWGAEKVKEDYSTWYQHGKNAIRLVSSRGKNYIFVYNGTDDWFFCTLKYFLKNSKETKK